MKIIFIGTGKFGAQILERLAETNYRPDFLICAYDKPVGRKQILSLCPTKEVAKKLSLEIAEFNTLKGREDFFKKLAPDLIIVADTNFILPKEILLIPKYGCLNIHPSLLPRYRGPSPIQATILSGDEETGVTIILMDEQIDHGSIIKNKKIKIKNKKIRLEPLRRSLANLGAEMLIDTIPQWIKGQIIPARQNEEEATYTKKLTKKDGQINWQKTAQEIDNQIRALNPWPGTYSFFDHKGKKLRLKIIEAEVYKLKSRQGKAGQIIKLNNQKMLVNCGSGALILKQVQVEGKKIIKGETFLNGYFGVKTFQLIK